MDELELCGSVRSRATDSDWRIVQEAGECRQRLGPRYFVTVATKQQIASLRPPAFVQGQRLCRTAHPHPSAEPSWIRHVETIEQLRAFLAFKYTYNGGPTNRASRHQQPGRVSSEAASTRRQGIIGLNPIFQRPGLYKRQPTAIARRRYRLIYAASPPRASSCYTCWGPIREEATIHHLSIAAQDPKHAASMLAQIMGGTAVPFPPNPGSFFALQLDEHGSGAEVYPAGTELQPVASSSAASLGRTHANMGRRISH